MSDKTILQIRTDAPIGTVSPRLYGHFAEHLGRCCYDGLWVGHNSKIDHVGGFRRDVLQALQAMPTPMLRWPGGCYADHYHWRDGIGAERPVRLGLSCGLQVEDDNALGTHEFLDYCEQIGAEPYLAGNMGSGSVQEMCDWVEYCNASVHTSLVRERHANGRQAPFGVKLWGVGNENWGCGGNYSPESYGLEYRRYATMLQHVDPSAELVLGGHQKDWNERVMRTLKDYAGLVDHFSIHQYWLRGGPGVGFTEDDYYRLLNEADETEDFVKETRAILDEATGGRKKIGIALDEWGVWHPEVRSWGDGGTPGCDVNNYEQACTLRDALAANAALEGFHRQCNSLSMCNLAQIVNVLHAPIRTQGDKMWLTPTYHLLNLHAPHVGATAVPVSIDGPALPDGKPAVSATATIREGKIAITVMNRHFRNGAAIQLPIDGDVRILTSDSAAYENDPDSPNRVGITRGTLSGDRILELPKHSVATVF